MINLYYSSTGDKMNDRKRAVLLTAKRLFIKKGFAATSIQDILDEAKISKGTFYNYFPSKNACLIAILEHAQEEADIRRRELQIGQNKSNKSIFAKQISVRLQVNREHKLLPLFEAIYHSEEESLHEFIKKHHFAEVSWLVGRLVDVYGKEFEAYALDGAILMIGMIQHALHIWTLSSNEEIQINELIDYIIRRMDSMIPKIIDTKDKLIDDTLFFQSISSKSTDPNTTKTQLLDMLTTFENELEGNLKPKGKQFITFIKDELNSEQPRFFVMEAMIHSFLQLFKETSHELEARNIASRLLIFLKPLNVNR